MRKCAKQSITLLLICVPGWAMAADALFRSSFETSICTFNLESEPNDTAFMATVVGLDPTTKSALVCGENNPLSSDVDYFQISIASTSTLIAETVKADGAPCDSGSPQSLTLYNSSLTLVATDSGGGTDGCASLDGGTSPALQNLPAGNYYIKVTVPLVAAGTTTLVYALDIRLF